MDQDTADAITKMEQQMADRDQKFTDLEVAHRALALKLDNVDEWIERVNLAFVKELAK